MYGTEEARSGVECVRSQRRVASVSGLDGLYDGECCGFLGEVICSISYMKGPKRPQRDVTESKSHAGGERERKGERERRKEERRGN